MKRLLILTILVLLILVAARAAAIGPSNKFLSTNKNAKAVKSLQAHLKDYLKKDTELRHMKLLEQQISLLSQQVSGTSISAVFLIDRKYRLDYAKVEDAPALKGRLLFMLDNGERLSEDQKQTANDDIEIWRHDLTEYINTDQDITNTIKVTGKIDSSGQLMRSKVQFYGENVEGGYEPISLDDIPRPWQVEKDAYDALNAR